MVLHRKKNMIKRRGGSIHYHWFVDFLFQPAQFPAYFCLVGPPPSFEDFYEMKRNDDILIELDHAAKNLVIERKQGQSSLF